MQTPHSQAEPYRESACSCNYMHLSLIGCEGKVSMKSLPCVLFPEIKCKLSHLILICFKIKKKTFFLPGMPSALLTNQLRKMSGAARTRPRGCSRAATTTSWCGTTVRRCWWRQACSCGGSVSSWTTTTIRCPSTTPWIPSTFILSKSPSSCLLYPLLWSGTSQSWFSQDYLSQILSMGWLQISKSSSSSKWVCVDRNRRTWRGWKPATD